jgi:hypothetical protein
VTVSGTDCDVLNLSLGTPPLVPVPVEDEDGDGEFADELPELPAPYVPIPAQQLPPLVEFVSEAGKFAVANGTLPVASAGNSGVNLGTPVDIPDGGAAPPTVLPAEADGFLSVGAAGPIGFGWPADRNSETVAGFDVERPIQTELPTDEPAFYTNYGADAVDVTAGGGNADQAAIAEAGDGDAEAPQWFFDLVFSTGIANLRPADPDGDGEVENPEDALLNEYVPGYTFKAGTSFSAPNVAGAAALLFGAVDDATPETVRAAIEETARPLPVGRAGQTTAPGAAPNVGTDGTFDGDQPSAPGSNPGPFDVETYRGEGHLDVRAALREVLDDDGDDGDEGTGGGGNRGRGNG